MSESYPILDDYGCAHCNYNLRGLTLDHNYPECGNPVLDSVRLVLRPPRPRTRAEAAQFAALGARLRAAVKGSEYPIEAFSFMLGVLRYAFLRKSGGESAGGGVSVNARDVCDAVSGYGPLRLSGEAGAVRPAGGVEDPPQRGRRPDHLPDGRDGAHPCLPRRFAGAVRRAVYARNAVREAGLVIVTRGTTCAA